MVEPSPPSISGTFHVPRLKLCPHLSTDPHFFLYKYKIDFIYIIIFYLYYTLFIYYIDIYLII